MYDIEMRIHKNIKKHSTSEFETTDWTGIIIGLIWVLWVYDEFWMSFLL